MKIFTFYTPSHELIFHEWFLPSFKDEVEIKCEKFKQHRPTGHYMSDGWNRTMLDKLDYIIQAVDESEDYFIHADCDIQFFQPVVADLQQKMESHNLEILGQKDCLKRVPPPLCAGFFIAKSSGRLRQFFVNVKDLILRGIMENDQAALNPLLKYGANPLRYGYLGSDYFSVFMGNSGRRWEPGQKVTVPANIKMHHANWTAGLDYKVKLFKLIRDTYINNTKGA